MIDFESLFGTSSFLAEVDNLFAQPKNKVVLDLKTILFDTSLNNNLKTKLLEMLCDHLPLEVLEKLGEYRVKAITELEAEDEFIKLLIIANNPQILEEVQRVFFLEKIKNPYRFVKRD